MADEVLYNATLLEDPREEEMVKNYFQALLEGLQQAHYAGNFGWQGESLSGGKVGHYDDLQSRPDTLNYEFDIAENCNLQQMGEEIIEAVDTSTSSFQEIQFHHSYFPEQNRRDTCLTLSGFPQSCNTFRSHYHEILVHYPATFLADVKRVLFVGGGDLMILHEILKYPALEFVYGFELDQQVVRHSFRNYGIQPKFDDPRVRWSFGDASKSLLMLPKEYFGTFDLVLMDLQTYVADTVMVMEGVSLMDAGMQLLKPEGILVQNQDFAQQSKPRFAKYAVNMVFDDIPHYCQQYINMASNGINFSGKAPKAHKVPTLFFEPANLDRYYSAWTGYHLNHDVSSVTNVSEHRMSSDHNRSYGLTSFIEGENSTISLIDSRYVRDRIMDSLEKSNLRIASIEEFNSSESGDVDDYGLLFIMREGILVARMRPKLKYAAMDLNLWSQYETYEQISMELIDAVGCDLNGSTSSFRLATGGMLPIGPTQPVAIAEDSAIKTRDPGYARKDVQFQESGSVALAKIVKELADLVPSLEPNVLVVCGEEAAPCTSFEALRDSSVHENFNALPLWACPDIRRNGMQALLKCESIAREEFEQATNVGRQIHGVFVDPDAPREMGQIVHKILNNTLVRSQFLSDSFAVVAPTLRDDTDDWRGALLERFREMVVYNPVHHVDSVLHGASGSLRVQIFSAGDEFFYSGLTSIGASIQRKIAMELEIQSGRSGVVSYLPDFKVSKILSNEDFDVEKARAQFLGQKAISQQDLVQLEVDLPSVPLHDGQRVLANNHEHNWEGIWLPGEVKGLMEDNTYTVIMDAGYEVQIARHLIRKLTTDRAVFHAGQRVLFKTTIPEEPDYGVVWKQAYVTQLNADGTYQIRLTTVDRDWVESSVPREDLVSQMDEVGSLDPSRKTTSDRLVKVIKEIFFDLDMEVSTATYDDAGQGSILSSSWSDGNMVLTWDGDTHFDLNLFCALKVPLTVANTIVTTLRQEFALRVNSWDRQPRGTGRCVNFPFPDVFWFGKLGHNGEQ